MNLPDKAEVVIVGAGPVGLMAAAQLLQYGVRPVIIDKKTSPVADSRAIAIQARSLEIFSQLGIVNRFLKEGNKAECFIIHEGLKEIARLDYAKAGAQHTEFPFVLLLQQSKTERILLDFLTENVCPVFWNTKLVDLKQSEKANTLTVDFSGIATGINADWVVGADGAGSTVRKFLGINFKGGTYKQRFYLADLYLNNLNENDAVGLFLNKSGFTGVFPLPGSITRLVGIVPKSLKNKENLTFNDIKPFLAYDLDFPASGEQCKWFSTYRLHHLSAEKFSSKNCFLIGDAAHVHSPAGGQGMNSGFQDAYNLAWKLAGVIKGNFESEILNTYNEERIPAALQIMRTTDRLFSFLVSVNPILQTIRNWLLPQVLPAFWKKALTTKKIFKITSQTGLNYRTSRLSVHHSLSGKINAGDRLPYLKLFDEKLKQETDLHKWCSKPGFTLIVIGTLGQKDLLAIVKWIKLNFSFQLNFFYLPPSDRNQDIFDCFEIREGRKKAVIVRPDLHIGYINDIVDLELIDGYFKEAVRIKTNKA